jgi:hypothetical protein
LGIEKEVQMLSKNLKEKKKALAITMHMIFVPCFITRVIEMGHPLENIVGRLS